LSYWSPLLRPTSTASCEVETVSGRHGAEDHASGGSLHCLPLSPLSSLAASGGATCNPTVLPVRETLSGSPSNVHHIGRVLPDRAESLPSVATGSIPALAYCGSVGPPPVRSVIVLSGLGASYTRFALTPLRWPLRTTASG
jgi:hypothetical protein